MLPPKTRIMVCTEAVDMRKSFDGLAAATRKIMGQDPESGSLFIFTNKRANRLKAIWWDQTGYAILYKRLEWGYFRLPSSLGEEARSVVISSQELSKILEGIGLPPKRHRLYEQSIQEVEKYTLQPSVY
jgi:transposase